MDAEFFVDETFNTGLEAIFEAVFAGGYSIIYGTAGKVAFGEDESIHLGVDGEVILHGAFGESHFGFVSTLEHAIVAKRDYAFIAINDHAAHFG